MHQPVLLNEVLEVFAPKTLSIFVDGTVGFGGHARGLLEAHEEIEKYIACDRDPIALEHAQDKLKMWWKKVEWVRGSYGDLETFLDERGIDSIDGFLIDIGVSSMQLDERGRGFSFLGEAPLDMRMDPDQARTAAWVVNTYPEKELSRIFFEYGEERNARKMAKAIVLARKKRKITTTQELVDIIKPFATRKKIHPATLVFQALRIEVNEELRQLEQGLQAAMRRVSPGGRIAVISFHSLEDRIVKNLFREAKDTFHILTKKPLQASLEEIRKNPRSRSAKLRAVEKKDIEQ